MSSSRENLPDHAVFPAGRRQMSLTVSGSGVAVYPPGATFGPRRLEDFEFVWLLQGASEWRYGQGSIVLGPNSLLLGRPGITDSFIWGRPRRTGRVCGRNPCALAGRGITASFIWDRTRPPRHAYLHFQLIGQLPGLPDPA